MTTRKSGSRRSGNTNAAGIARLRDSLRDKGRLRTKRRRQDRRSLLETLEQRQLLAGPQLVGIQPNEGSLLFEGTELNTAPRELVFQFDDATKIDPATLDGIRITRAGDDNVFESAEATSDLGTDGAVLVQFRAVESGVRGNGIRLVFTTRSRNDTSLPLINVNGQTVSVELNSNPSRATTVRDLVQGLANSEASDLVLAIQVSGASQTRIGEQVPSGTEVVLTGANAAQAFTDLGTENAIRVRVLSVAAGAAGRGQQLIVEQRDFGGPALPVVLTEERTVRVLVNSAPGAETTAQEFIDAINNNPQAGDLLELQLEAGSGDTLIGNRTPFYSPLTLTGASDITIEPGFVGLGDSPNQVVFRFAEPLPDDTYQIDILGTGAAALQNTLGEAFGDGVTLSRQFEINLGPQVLAVVPEPVRRLPDGSLSPEVGMIEVHFNDDDLARQRPVDPNNPNGPTERVAENRDFYQLFYSRNTANGNDDPPPIKPVSVSYNAATNIARLQFADPLARVPDPANPGQFLSGGVRLRIGTDDLLPAAPTEINLSPNTPDPGDRFSTAFDLTAQIDLSAGGTQSAIVSSEISNESRYGLQFPGGPDMPGVRQIRPEDPTRVTRTVPLDYLRRGADSDDGISRVFYDFASSFLGDDPSKPGIDNDTTYFNVITEEQKQRVREVLSLFSEYLGIQFVESTGGPADDAFFTIAVGDLHGADPAATSGPGGLAVATGDRNADGFDDIGVLDFQDFDASTDDQFGGEFFRGAMLLVGQMLGYGYADDLPQPVTQSTLSVFNPGGVNEPTFPSAADIVNGQFLYRPESLDIDLYRFELDRSGTVSIQTIAERLTETSLLDTALRLYKQLPDGGFEEIAANDDYFSSDSLIEMELTAGTYVVGVSSTGNTKYDPAISDTGMGGRTEGAYDLRIEFQTNGAAGLTDATGVPLDGDNDGKPGGVHNFWFAPSDPTATLFVDKATTSSGSGTINNPFANLGDAIAQARPGQTIRVVANGGIDGLVETADDNFSYQIGTDSFGNPLQDGETLDVPRGVTLVMDAGVIVKMQRARVGVGSTSPTIDRSGAALQLLGTPSLRNSNGQLVRDANNELVPGSVYFTSFNDDTIGNGNTPQFTPAPKPGDWGGLDFRGDLDAADESRVNLEDLGLFLNQVQFADLRYGGGRVSVDGRSIVVSPVDMATTRATVAHSRITDSADAAIAATPNTFTETRFDETAFQADELFTPDYRRVGPDIHHNFIVDNSINGLFVRVVTRTGESVQPLTTQARFDDTDIPHVLTENLIIQGTPGGPILDSQAPSTLLIRLAADANGNVAAGTYSYKLTNVDASGQESPASASTPPVTLSSPGSIRLSQLPRTPAGGEFVARRLYRATLTTDPVTGELVEGPYQLVASLNASSTSFTDNNTNPGAPLVEGRTVFRARVDARLAIDPGTTIKLDSARIEVQFGAQLLAEGTEGRPIVFTSLEDQRYGGSGTFDTNSRGSEFELTPGAWGGIYAGHTSKASLDHTVIAGAGGVTRIEGGFASFNPIEVHQAQVRVTNSVFEMNADGRSDLAGDRVGRGDNAPGTIFVRGAAPIIVGNELTGGGGAAISFDVNSLSSFAVNDWGNSRGDINKIESRGNAGPLVRDNALGNNDINGLQVRGGELATEGVWDDTDIVHVVTDTIEVPNQFVYGGLRLESDARSSLVVKFESGETSQATIVVGGTLLTAEGQLRDIPDRIGGSLQIVGHPDFPVVLTSLKDDSAGAGFDPQGRPQVDTNNDGVFGADGGPQAPDDFVALPAGPEVNNGLLIDDDLAPTTDGFFEARPGAGGEVVLGGNAQTVAAANGQLVAQNMIFQFSNYVIAGGTTLRLGNTTITQQPTLVADDRVESRGTFTGDNGDVEWTAATYFRDGIPVMFNEISFESDQPLGDIRFVNFHHQDVPGSAINDFLTTRGTPGQADFRALIVSATERIGFAHGGYYENGPNQDNASYVGWAADIFADLQNDIQGNAATFSLPGVIDAAAIGNANDPDFGAVFGYQDVNTAFAWDVDGTATSSRITSFLELVYSDAATAPAASPGVQAQAGDWNGLVVREAASDRNVAAVSEAEHDGALMPGTNATPGQAQFLGELAPDEVSGDENRRLGFVVDGYIAKPNDIDVYSFIAESGTEVWFDIDRTDLGFDSVLELIDANGEILALSNDSIAEERDPSRLVISDRLGSDSVRPMAEIGERTETQRITISENIVDADGFLTIGLEGSNVTTQISVADFVANPAGSVRLAVASQFGTDLGPVTVSLVRRDARQVDPNDSSNVLVPGDDFVLEIRYQHSRYLGSDVPDLQFTTDDLSPPAGETVDVTFEEVIDESRLQDRYSTNPRDAGMRVILPGETGTRNLYHLRVRSSNAATAADEGNLTDPAMVRRGLTAGEYQLQVRLRELDEFPGTQVRFADVRYATNGIQVIGQPFHSPLLGDEYETAGANELIADAQPLGPFGVGADGSSTNSGPLSSDLLAKSIGGVLDSATDIDWYQFDVQYENLTRDAASMFMSTIFDLDYADNFARADMAVYVFDESGRLILVGGDSNIADDQPRAGRGADSTDLSRGSAGTLDPYIGATELSEGTYFVAVANQSQIPLPMDQYYNPNSANPLLRLEPIDSVVRIAEDRIGSSGGGTAAAPQVPVLFDPSSAPVPLALNDLITYTIGSTGNGVEQTIQLINPFTGERYGEIGTPNQDIADFAFLPNGELFGYSRDLLTGGSSDTGWEYFRISSEDGTLTNLGPTEMQTFHIQIDNQGNPQVVVSDDGVHPEAIAFRDNSLGFFVGNRPFVRPGPDYFSNILYQFDPQTGEPFSGPRGDRQIRNVNGVDIDERADGAGTQIRERGFIETREVDSNGNVLNPQTTPRSQLIFPEATRVEADGTTTAIVNDGDQFTITLSNGQQADFEMNSGPTYTFRHDAASGVSIRDGALISVTSPNGTRVYEFNTGPVLVLDSTTVRDGSRVTLTDQNGVSRTFEFDSNGALSDPNAIRVSLRDANGNLRDQQGQVDALIAAISSADFALVAEASQGLELGRIQLRRDSQTTPPTVSGGGLTVEGNHSVNQGNQNTQIRVEENASRAAFAAAIARTVGNGVVVGFEGDRINFRGATSADVTSLQQRGIITATTGTGGVSGGAIAVPFSVSDRAEDLATRAAVAINNASLANTTASANGRVLTLSNGSVRQDQVDPVFQIPDLAPGGRVTGITFIGNVLYAVSDQGGLYRVNNPTATIEGAIGDYVGTATDLLGIPFTGLTVGPPEVEGGRFADLLFGSTANGRVYAFNTAGELQPVFSGGRTNIDVNGNGGVRGIQFSTLDYNLWHTTQTRGNDLGHGYSDNFSNTRLQNFSRVLGGTSFRFGYEDSAFGNLTPPAQDPIRVLRQDGQPVENTYNFPGGAHGTLESNGFDLAGYSAEDQPFLYFNYFLETDSNDGLNDQPQQAAADLDAFRVYVITDDGVEHLVATNNSVRGNGFADDEFDDPRRNSFQFGDTYDDDIDVDVQELFDNTNSWRQARVALGEFAGQENLRLRIDFSTAGQIGRGDIGLRTKAGSRLQDGQVIRIGGETFEIAMGPTVVVPAGRAIADFYAAADAGNPGSAPNTRVTLQVGGLTFVLNDGLRDVDPQADEVNVLLSDPTDPNATPLAQLSAAEVADILSQALAANRPPATVDNAFDFTVESNNELAQATPLPDVAGDLSLSGTGELQDVRDVDLFSIDALNGTLIEASATQQTGSGVNPLVRLFDAEGNQLAVGSGPAGVQFTVPRDGTYYIGFSSDDNDDYNPVVAGSGSDGDIGTYGASITITRDFRVLTQGNRVEITGGFEVTTPASSPLTVEGTPGSDGVPVQIDSSMTAAEVASVLRDAIARRFAEGERDVYPVSGSKITLAGLAIQDAGPFDETGLRWGDNFGTEGARRARDNAFEGLYVDDFIIGFAERGELATGANGTNTFIADPAPNLTSPPQPVSGLVTGSYQLEIRDASEYVASAVSNQFRAFDTNARLAPAQSITARPAVELVDGATFTIGDGNSSVTFEFDLAESNTGVSPGNVGIPYSFNVIQPGSEEIDPQTGEPIPGTGVVRPQTASEVAEAIVAAINSSEVQLVLNVSALLSSGVDATNDARINLFGTSLIQDSSGALASVERADERGDENRDRRAQGMILIENSRFIYSEQFGIDLVHDTTANVAGNTTQNLVRYPRNLVELNTEQLAPGVVVQSNVLAFNDAGGLQITGINAGQAAANPVPFDRIINNTIIGGSVEPGQPATAATFQGIIFDLGTTAFADRVVSYTPDAGGGPQPNAAFRNANTALGAPQLAGRGTEPTDGLSTVSLGNGGTLVLAFSDNLLTGSGDSLPDLAIFEAGAVESVRVEISRDGTTYHNVGIVGGASNVLDIDAFGFGPEDRFAFVRLTDLRQGAPGSSTIGADIDAVGAISSVAADQYNAGGTGITIRQNAAPTLLNNIVANSETGISIDGSSNKSVLGGTTFYRNTEDTSAGVAPGQFAQHLADAQQVFVSAGELIFTPAAGSSIIDSSINSLQDRSSLVTVRNAIGLPPSPILAPTFDVNGQLRVDDPNVESPFGSGESVFKDRGAADRADTSGPRAILVSPRAAELGPQAGIAQVIGEAPHAFEIQLIDGIAPSDPAPGVGVDDRSVSSDSILLLKDGVPQIEGVDYRFGYNPSTNIIRLTALAGVFERNSVYVVRLLDNSEAVIQSAAGTQLNDGAVFNVIDRQGGVTRFEYETGIRITLPAIDGSTDPDGITFAISDGPLEVTFEIDTNGATTGGNVPISLSTETTVEEVLETIASTINSSGLQVTATVLETGEIALTGTQPLTAFDPLDSGATAIGSIGTAVGFGIGIPNNGLLADGIDDGESFTISRGALQTVTFEFDTNGSLNDPDAVRVTIPASATLDQVADALVRAIGGSGLGLNPFNVGAGRVVLNGNANYSLDLTNSDLNQLGLPGDRATIPVVVPPESTAREAAEIIAQTIEDAGLPGVDTSIVDTRIFVTGTRGITGAGAVDLVTIQDTVGNRLQSNQPNGRTELTIFVGAGFDYGDAPAPYPSLLADNGPRHEIDPGLTLGEGVTADGDARLPNADNDEGVSFRGPVRAGFDATLDVEIQSDGRDFVLDVWVDWNGNGEFENTPAERRRFGSPGNNLGLPTVFVGQTALNLRAPADAAIGTTYARVRLSSESSGLPVGPAIDGEVADVPVLVQANPFRNPDPQLRADVNDNDIVTPLDALLIINAMNRAGTTSIPLSPPPNISLPPYPDVNGDGFVNATDALGVIRELNRIHNSASGEGESTLYVAGSSGVMASVPTALGDALTLGVPPLKTGASAEGERILQDPPEVLTSRSGNAASVGDSSVFDSAEAIALDEILDTLADRPSESAGDGKEESVDSVFAEFGR